MKISLIIPTLHRSIDLTTTLDTLLVSSIVPYDIIIVDQSDDDKTNKLVNNLLGQLPIRYFHFSIKSLAEALERVL